MNTRFHVDLLHPGWEVETWQDWFTGPLGGRRLGLFAAGSLAVLLIVLVAGLLPTYWSVSADSRALPSMRRDLSARDAELMLLRSNVQALSQEARRQVRWADVLGALGRAAPASLRLQLVELARVVPPPPGAAATPAPGQGASAASKADEVLRIEAVTPLRPGSAALVDLAQLIGALARDPALAARFELRSWDVKPSPVATPTGEQLLGVSIVMAERPR